MEKYREASIYGKTLSIYGAIILLLILMWMGWQAYELFHLRAGLGGFIYACCFLGLFLWRFAFRYTYILTDSEFIFVTEGLGLKRSFTVSLDSVESFSNHYQKKFFKKTGIKKYIYRYSSGDDRQLRILVINTQGKLSAILFKASDDCLDTLKNMLPTKFLDLQNKDKG